MSGNNQGLRVSSHANLDEAGGQSRPSKYMITLWHMVQLVIVLSCLDRYHPSIEG